MAGILDFLGIRSADNDGSVGYPDIPWWQPGAGPGLVQDRTADASDPFSAWLRTSGAKGLLDFWGDADSGLFANSDASPWTQRGQPTGTRVADPPVRSWFGSLSPARQQSPEAPVLNWSLPEPPQPVTTATMPLAAPIDWSRVPKLANAGDTDARDTGSPQLFWHARPDDHPPGTFRDAAIGVDLLRRHFGLDGDHTVTARAMPNGATDFAGSRDLEPPTTPPSEGIVKPTDSGFDSAEASQALETAQDDTAIEPYRSLRSLRRPDKTLVGQRSETMYERALRSGLASAVRKAGRFPGAVTRSAARDGDDPDLPEAKAVEWGDFANPFNKLMPKAIYQLAEGSPTLAAGVGGGLGGGAIGGMTAGPGGAIVGAVGGSAVGAGAMTTAMSLGSYYQKELKGGSDPDAAFDAALKRAAVDGAISSATFAALGYAPFASTVKNMLFQAAVQPPLSVPANVARNIVAGRPAGEDITADVPGAMVGALVPAGATRRVHQYAREQFPGVYINGRWVEAKPDQVKRFAAADLGLQEALRDARRTDAKYEPPPSIYGPTVEDAINKRTAQAYAARTRGAAGNAHEAYHYTAAANVPGITTTGLHLPGYLVMDKNLSPLQAQIDLALKPNRDLPDSIVRVDLGAMARDGVTIPRLGRVARSSGMPGGAYEMMFPRGMKFPSESTSTVEEIPARYLKEVQR